MSGGGLTVSSAAIVGVLAPIAYTMAGSRVQVNDFARINFGDAQQEHALSVPRASDGEAVTRQRVVMTTHTSGCSSDRPVLSQYAHDSC